MIKSTKINLVFLALLGLISLSSCKDVWKDHNELNMQMLDKTLATQISENDNLSLFNSYLIKTGYDKVLASAKTFTVWAPLNSALQNLDPNIVSDTAKLKAFVGNHISYQSYFTQTPQPSLIIRTLNGKNITFTATSFEDAQIVDADLYLKNGVLHTVDEASIPKPNAWEFLQSSSLAQKEALYIASLDHVEVDTTNGVKLYTDPITGQTVFQDGTTSPVIRNSYFQKVANLSSEDSLITVIVLNDAAFDFEVDKLKPFYKSLDPAITDAETKYSATRDLVIKGVYDLNNLPDSLTATSGIKVHLDKNAVVQTKKLSNGIAYVVNSIGYKVLENKIRTIVIQGELTDSIRSQSAVIYKRQKSPDGFLFDMIQSTSITSSPSPLYYYRYKTFVNSTKYAVYWRSIHDISTITTPFYMAVKFNTAKKYVDGMAGTGYVAVQPYDATIPATYRETYLGEYTPENFGTLYTFLVSALGVTSSAPTALSLDYIKLVPIN